MAIDTNDNEVLARSVEWLDAGYGVELVTVARTWGSSPRPPGSLAAVREDGVLVGSVSGGCVEKQLSESFKGQSSNRVFTHHIDDQQARQFGLTCGGNLELVFESLNDAPALREVLSMLGERKRVRRLVSIDSKAATLAEATREDAFEYDGKTLQKIFGPAWRVLLIGAGQLSRYTAEFALALDYEVFVCEPREHFRKAWDVAGTTLLEDMPDDAVLAHASDAQSAILALTHDPTLDDLALQEGLPGNAFYVGALGSRKNADKRRSRLNFLGVDDNDIDKLHGPIGLHIGSRTSSEIAISIIAELIKVRSKLATSTPTESSAPQPTQ